MKKPGYFVQIFFCSKLSLILSFYADTVPSECILIFVQTENYQ